jgi:hypothetical protein
VLYHENGMAIDNRTDKIREIVNESTDTLITALMQSAGAFSPIFAVAAAVKGMFDFADFHDRVFACIRALCDEFEAMRGELPSDAEAVLQSSWFKQAVRTLILQTAMEADERRAVMLARATAHGCFPNKENEHRREDLASYIRDLARLGTDDIAFLKLTRDVYSDEIRRIPNMNRMDDFTNKFAEFKRRTNELSIHVDDTVALGARLSGFGLAYEVPRSGLQSTSEYSFRPTRRGLYLLSLLDAAEVPTERQN